FVFRFNRRTSTSRGLLFYRLLQQAMQTERLTYRAITEAPQKELRRR
ncbi:IS1595 family transposase, partial [Klebsiella pneumoniae]|nr:IS1595 family transposase [Klebsiella pneumoniae]